MDLPAILGISIPIFAMCIPIVAILVRHQQRMAEIIHGRADENVRGQIEALWQEVADLKHRLQISESRAALGEGLEGRLRPTPVDHVQGSQSS